MKSIVKLLMASLAFCVLGFFASGHSPGKAKSIVKIEKNTSTVSFVASAALYSHGIILSGTKDRYVMIWKIGRASGPANKAAMLVYFPKVC